MHPLAQHPTLARPLRIGMLAPIAWRVPPRHYGPWERLVSLLTEGLVSAGAEVTLFATADSETSAPAQRGGADPLRGNARPRREGLGGAASRPCFRTGGGVRSAAQPLRLPTAHLCEPGRDADGDTIHGFSGDGIMPAYRAFNGRTRYVSISASDRHPYLDYIATVHHGIDLAAFTYQPHPGTYLLFFGRIHPDKGAADAIRVARAAGLPLVLAGVVQDQAHFDREIAPHLSGAVRFVGSVGPEARDKWLGGALGLLHLIHLDEPFGLSVIEAMACGTPVIAYRRGSMAELIVDGTSGFLVADEAAATNAVGRLAALDRSAVRSYAAGSFSVGRMVIAYLAAYQKMLALNTRAPIQPRNRPGW